MGHTLYFMRLAFSMQLYAENSSAFANLLSRPSGIWNICSGQHCVTQCDTVVSLIVMLRKARRFIPVLSKRPDEASQAVYFRQIHSIFFSTRRNPHVSARESSSASAAAVLLHSCVGTNTFSSKSTSSEVSGSQTNTLAS